MPQIADDNRRVADLADVYADASPDLWEGLDNAVQTAGTFNDHRADIDEALMAALGFADDAADSFERGGPYLLRGAADLVPTSKLLDDYRGMIFCTIRKFSVVQKRAAAVLGGNGYSLASSSGTLAGAGNPYVLSRQPAAGERARRPRGPPRLLARRQPRPMARALSGNGHRRFHRAVQPLRTGAAADDRLRVGPPDRREHDQPVTVDIKNC
jgi:phospholipid/cholesterol/gamma-HCH transport system substrate-binding protein